jgi:hypothetical protein
MERGADGTSRAAAGRVPERRGRLASREIVDGLGVVIEQDLLVRVGEYEGWFVVSTPDRGWVAIDVLPRS